MLVSVSIGICLVEINALDLYLGDAFVCIDVQTASCSVAHPTWNEMIFNFIVLIGLSADGNVF